MRTFPGVASLGFLALLTSACATIDEEALGSEEAELLVQGAGAPGGVVVPPLAVVDLALDSARSCVVYGNGSMKCAGRMQAPGGSWHYPTPTAMQVSNAVLSDGQYLVSAPDGLVQTVPIGPTFATTTLSGFSAVIDVASEAHKCFVRDDGTAYCWGTNTNMQCGADTGGAAITTPRTVGPTRGVAQVVAGGRFTCFRELDGDVRCVGAGPVVVGFAVPFPCLKTTGVIDMDAKGDNICVVAAAGGISCWGNNQFGQLGFWSPIDDERGNPIPVPGMEDAVEVTVGYQFACGRLPNGSVKCWGKNDKGQLGNGTTATWLPPVTVRLPRPATHIDAGFAHTCARLDDNSVRCWGSNGDGRLGFGYITAFEATPKLSSF